MIRHALIAAALLPAAASAQTVPSPERLRATVSTLVSFGTRHTLSSQDDPKRGIGAARRWAEAQLRRIGAQCSDCLVIDLPERMVTSARIPTPTRLVNVVAIQKGTERPDEVTIIQAHIDTRVSDPMNATADAPGANDDGSGVALVLEAARIMSKRQFPTTVVYAILSGEEQGLLGGRLLADVAAERGWKVKAVLNNDIVGNTRGSDGLVDDKHIRVFSEGPRANADAKLTAAQRREGGENDGPSRNLSRFIAGLSAPDLAVRQVWRADRVGRGGDHLPFEEKGFPAVRFTVAVENYDHQHQDIRREGATQFGDTMEFMDFPYLARVTALNIRAATAIAAAPMPPAATQKIAVSPDTQLSWNAVAGAKSYALWRRRTDASGWEAKPFAITQGTSITLKGLRGDDWFFGLSARAANGAQSPIASALPGGAYERAAP
ncbi:M20/M25/M40 family metallo-hydrolase [Novosphingobium umbonatum]|uniref:M20/M25/M40 family metallo-hydrolase n=1 Tax=Novosphingobium umbonatum TaxID=1908524 RepID=A0A3S2V8D0_9SPHN|nr:M20/M25/M40 family metallo-hydrolase [Novosphingobium umbonatum]RVU06247.1 M20/M25/M40 family metallo-hydrolase [Novosphingobium umbonatum]